MCNITFKHYHVPQVRLSFWSTHRRTSTSWRWTRVYRWNTRSPSVSPASTSSTRWSDLLKVTFIIFMSSFIVYQLSLSTRWSDLLKVTFINFMSFIYCISIIIVHQMIGSAKGYSQYLHEFINCISLSTRWSDLINWYTCIWIHFCVSWYQYCGQLNYES